MIESMTFRKSRLEFRIAAVLGLIIFLISQLFGSYFYYVYYYFFIVSIFILIKGLFSYITVNNKFLNLHYGLFNFGLFEIPWSKIKAIIIVEVKDKTYSGTAGMRVSVPIVSEKKTPVLNIELNTNVGNSKILKYDF